MAKIDLHCHSIYSEHPSEWFLQRLGAAESYTDPKYIYKELKKKGMDFITITDHNRIAGALLLQKKYPDKVIVGLEATTYFPEDGCKVHILIYGVNEKQFETIQKKRSNIYDLRDYIKQQDLAYSVAHATYSINGKLKIEHLEKLLILFDVFETINGSRSDIHNHIWQKVLQNLTPEIMEELQQKHKLDYYSSTPWIKGTTAGSDDHAGIFLGQTYTEANAQTTKEFLEKIKQKATSVEGRHNDFISLAFTIYKIAVDFAKSKSKNVENSIFGYVSDFIYDNDSVNFLNRIKIKNLNRLGRKNKNDYFKQTLIELIETLQKEKDLCLEKRFNIAFEKFSNIVDSFFKVLFESFEKDLSKGNMIKVIRNISSTLPGIFLTLPFYTTIHHMFNNRELINDLKKRFNCEEKSRNKNILWFTDTISDLNGVSATLDNLYEISKKDAHSIKIISACENKQDDENFINLPIMHEFELPYYEHQSIKVPSPLTAIKKIYQNNPDKIIISTPGPIGLLALLACKLFHIKSIGIYHTDFTMQTSEIRKDDSLISIVDSYTHWFYQNMDIVYVPSLAYMNILEERGIDRFKMKIFPRGLEYDTFYPVNLGRAYLIEKYNLPNNSEIFLYTGRISKDKNLEIILTCFREIWKQNKDYYLILVGDGPNLQEFKKKYEHQKLIFTGRIARAELPKYYSGADVFLFPSTTDTYGMSVLEAQACCLPALVTDKGGPKEIIEHGRTGYIVEELTPQKWQNQINRMIEIKKTAPEIFRTMKVNSRENARKKSSWNKVITEFVS